VYLLASALLGERTFSGGLLGDGVNDRNVRQDQSDILLRDVSIAIEIVSILKVE
jgi:hypothetical protein